MQRLGFSMLELVFVIVIMGILAKFGVEFLAQSYRGFIYANVNHNLQANAQMAVETVASRLQYRIKDSVIKRQSANFNTFEAIGASVTVGTESDYNVLEWIGTDIEGFRGDTRAAWSGIIDLTPSTALILNSPDTNTTQLNALIRTLSNTSSDFNDSALYFIGSESNRNSWYWDANASQDQSGAIHPIQSNAQVDEFMPIRGDNGAISSFAGEDVYEYYQLAWTAYAVGINDYNTTTNSGTLRLWYNYQPWQGERYDQDGNSSILMENVSTFQFKSIGSLLKIQVCVNSDIINGTANEGGYSLCKEKTIY